MNKVIIINGTHRFSQEELDILMQYVPQEKQERVKRFHHKQDASNCLIGDVLTRLEICNTIGLCNNQLEFSTNEYGKPLLVNNPGIHFNISHTGQYVAFVMSTEPVGIDIELIKNADLKIAERFFTPDEIAYIKEDNSNMRFYEVWTKKESRIKWEGKGLHLPLNSFSVLDTKEHLYYHNIFQNNEVICHVCSQNFTIPSIELMNTEGFIKKVIEFTKDYI